MPSIDELEAMLSAVRKLHADGGASQGYTDDDYGVLERACTTCGAFGEYGVEWPCDTYKAATRG